MLVATAAAAGLLGLAHLLAPWLRFVRETPRSRVLSAAGGISVGYVFVHLLPALGQRGARLAPAAARLPSPLAFLEHHAYLLALIGLVLFYGLERAARLSRRRRAARRSDAVEPAAGPIVFHLHMASFGLYNALVGYLLLRGEARAPGPLAAYVVAMALHFIVNDFGLRAHHEARYDRYGRWILAAAAPVGWAVGVLVRVGEPAVTALFAVLAGGITLNVLKEELPEERESRLWAFAAGALGYALLLLAA